MTGSVISMSEQMHGVKVEQKADQYLKKYRSHIEAMESKSLISKVRTITPYDVYALGHQLESFELYKNMCEEDGTVAQLGKVPDVAFDVISVAYSTSPISIVASVQPIDEELGTVYFKNVIAQTTRGNVTAGNRLVNPRSMEDAAALGYARETVVYAAGNTVDMTVAYSGTVPNGPFRPGSFRVSIATLDVYLTDDGAGHLLGYQAYGTVNYGTGAYTLTLASNPGAGKAISVEAATDFEGAQDIPKIITKLESTQVRAEIYALKDTIGLEQSYALRRRFGMIAEEEVANDLVAAINSEVMNTMISKLNAKAVGNTNWSKTPSSGVSYYEHKQSFVDALANAESTMLGNAGRGTLNVLIAGRNASAILSTLPGFVKISDGTNIGPHIFGTFNGATVIRVPNTNVLNADKVLCLYNGLSSFESAAVFSPYMPLVVTTALPAGNNPLMNQKAAAIWAATEVLVPAFLTSLTITA